MQLCNFLQEIQQIIVRVEDAQMSAFAWPGMGSGAPLQAKDLKALLSQPIREVDP
jgi:hypothetical protein